MEPILVDSWAELATVPLAVMVAGLVVQFSKVFLDWHARGWQRLSAATAVVFMLAVTVAAGADALPLAVVLAIVNGMIAGVAASKGYDVTVAAVERVRD